jgi:hypothetical protein
VVGRREEGRLLECLDGIVFIILMVNYIMVIGFEKNIWMV